MYARSVGPSPHPLAFALERGCRFLVEESDAQAAFVITLAGTLVAHAVTTSTPGIHTRSAGDRHGVLSIAVERGDVSLELEARGHVTIASDDRGEWLHLRLLGAVLVLTVGFAGTTSGDTIRDACLEIARTLALPAPPSDLPPN